MRFITVTQATLDLIEAHADQSKPFRSTAVLQPDGRYRVPIEEDVAEALESLDPDPDVAIHRMCTTGVGHS